MHSIRRPCLKITMAPPVTGDTAAPRDPPPQHRQIPPPHEPKTNAKMTAGAKATAKYRARDAHEAFFRPKQPATRRSARLHQRKPKQKPTKPWTNKQRQQFARDHYARHHGPSSSPLPSTTPPTTNPTTSTTLLGLSPTPWSPTILGHHQSNPLHLSPNQTLSISPPTMDAMIQYFDNTKGDLRNLDLSL